jgi:hypothetical protein
MQALTMCSQACILTLNVDKRLRELRASFPPAEEDILRPKMARGFREFDLPLELFNFNFCML